MSETFSAPKIGVYQNTLQVRLTDGGLVERTWVEERPTTGTARLPGSSPERKEDD